MAGDELQLVAAIRSKHKARSVAVVPPEAVNAGRRAGAGGHVASLVLALTNNSLEVWDVSEGSEPPEGAAASGASGVAERAQAIDLPGHRADVRALALAGDDSLVLSASNNCVKVGPHCERGRQ
jgi:U3 small nucleolar RNA-associated protein 12